MKSSDHVASEEGEIGTVKVCPFLCVGLEN